MKNKILNLLRKLSFFLLFLLGNLFLMTWRIKNHNKDILYKAKNNGELPVLILWHDILLPVSYSLRHDKIITMASSSKDGDIIAFMLKRWGFIVTRGSSTRGGIRATLDIIKTCKSLSRQPAITVDGPKGPRHELKSGAVFIAKHLDKKLIAITVNTSRFWRFNSWDKFILPKPFAKVDIFYSDPFEISSEVKNEALERDRKLTQDFLIGRTNETSTNLL